MSDEHDLLLPVFAHLDSPEFARWVCFQNDWSTACQTLERDAQWQLLTLTAGANPKVGLAVLGRLLGWHAAHGECATPHPHDVGVAALLWCLHRAGRDPSLPAQLVLRVPQYHWARLAATEIQKT